MFVSTKVVLFIALANNDVIKNCNKACLRRLYRCVMPISRNAFRMAGVLPEVVPSAAADCLRVSCRRAFLAGGVRRGRNRRS